MDTPAEWYNWEVPANSFVRMYVTNRVSCRRLLHS